MDEIKWTNTLKALEEYIATVRNQYQDSLIKNGHVATGKLLNSIDYVIDLNGYSITASLRLEDYYKFVENGRGPGKFPPIDKIISWVKNKPIYPSEKRKGKLPTEKQLAFLIGRKIAKYGTKGTHDLSNTLESLNALYAQRIETAVRADIENSLSNFALVIEFK